MATRTETDGVAVAEHRIRSVNCSVFQIVDRVGDNKVVPVAADRGVLSIRPCEPHEGESIAQSLGPTASLGYQTAVSGFADCSGNVRPLEARVHRALRTRAGAGS